MKETDKALVVAGSVNADMVLQVDRLPKEGETLAASNLQTFPGGKVCNLAYYPTSKRDHTRMSTRTNPEEDNLIPVEREG